MTDLKFDASMPGLSQDAIDAATRAEELGFDGIWSSETANDAFLPHPVAAEHTSDITLGTRIALSFTRSPMVLAYTAWDLADYSDGRFVLGLGTQVKGHNIRRFSVDFEWESPGPRLKEVVESIKHIFDVFQGREDRLNYEGEYYSFSLMTDFFDPGPIDNPDVPIFIAGVNEYNLRLAGEVCDGIAMHGFNTPEYTRDVIVPTVKEGADKTGRSLDEVDLAASPMIITGETEEEIAQSREATRRQISFYGSTRTYHPVFEHHGWNEVGPELHELSVDGRFDEMPDLITDEILYTFAIEAEPGEVVDEVIDTYGDVADRVSIPLDRGEDLP